MGKKIWQKKFGSTRIWWKKIWVENSLGQKKFGRKLFASKKFRSKKVWVKKILGPKKMSVEFFCLNRLVRFK